MESGIRITGRLTFSVNVFCSNCKVSATSYHRAEVRSLDTSQLAAALVNKFAKETPNAPIGWTMNGRSNLICSKCK